MHVARQADTDLSQRSFSSTFLNKTQHRLEHSRLLRQTPHTPWPPYLQQHWWAQLPRRICGPLATSVDRKAWVTFPLTHVPLFLLPWLLEGWMEKKKNWPRSSCWFMLLFWSRGFILISWMNESVPLFQMIRVSVCPWNISQLHCDIMNKICCVFCES